MLGHSVTGVVEGAHDPQGQIIVGGEDPVGRGAQRLGPGADAGLGRPAAGVDDDALGPQLRAGAQEGVTARDGVGAAEVPGHVHQTTATGAHQVLRGRNGARRLVDGDGGRPVDPALPRQEDTGTLGRPGAELVQRGDAAGQDDRGRHPVPGQAVQSREHRPRGVVLGGGHDELVALLARRVGDGGEGGGRAVAELGHEQDPHGPTAPGRQRPCGEVGAVAQALDGVIDACARLGAHRGVVVQHTGDRLLGDTRLTSHIAHHHRAHQHVTSPAGPARAYPDRARAGRPRLQGPCFRHHDSGHDHVSATSGGSQRPPDPRPLMPEAFSAARVPGAPPAPVLVLRASSAPPTTT